VKQVAKSHIQCGWRFGFVESWNLNLSSKKEGDLKPGPKHNPKTNG
jgi:hypothetical protein